MKEELQSILIAVLLALAAIAVIVLFLLLTGIGHRLLELAAGFVAWVIITLVCL